MAGFGAAARFVVAVGLEEAIEEVPEAGAGDRFDDVGLEVHRGDELDAVVAEPFDDPDEGEDAGHGARCAVAQQHLGLFGVGYEGVVDGVGFDDAGGVPGGGELRGPCRDGGDAVGGPGREVGAVGSVAAVEQHAGSFDAPGVVGVGEDLVSGVAKPWRAGHRFRPLVEVGGRVGGASPPRSRSSRRLAAASGSMGWPVTT